MPLHTIRSLFARRTRLITELHRHAGPVISLAISAKGSMLASGGKLKLCLATNHQPANCRNRWRTSLGLGSTG